MSEGAPAGPRVAIFGFNAYGSFGDDLVAGILGAHLIKTHGAEVAVHRLCEPYARRFDLRVANNPDELVDGARLVIWAGGSTLEASPPPRRRVGMTTSLPAHAVDATRVLELAEARGVPVIGISIGGDGVYPRELYPPSKQRFLDQSSYISVRYPDDLRLLKESGTEGAHFPDLLWQAGPFLGSRRAGGDRLRVGVSVYAGQLLPQRAVWVPPLIYSAAWSRRDVEFVFFDSANRTRASFRALPRPPGARGENRMFENPDTDLELLASLDLLVSTHLPVGVAAMSFGVPFLAIAPDHRAERLMRDIGLEQLCFRGGDSRRLWKLLSGNGKLERFLDHFQVPELDALGERSAGHLGAAEAALTRASGRGPA